MIYGIGVDLLRVERGYRLWQRFGNRAVDKLLHPAETTLLDDGRHPGAVLARSFAAKEAFVKALGTGFRGVGFKEIGVVRSGSGRPEFVFSSRLRRMLERRGIGTVFISLSDEGGLVCAFVVLERQ